MHVWNHVATNIILELLSDSDKGLLFETDELDHPSLSITAKKGFVQCTEAILNHLDIDTPEAAANNHKSSVELLLQGGPDLEFIRHGTGGDVGFTPLSIAAALGYARVVKLLLEAGGNVNHLIGETKVHFIKYVHDEGTLAVILEFNPNLESEETYSETFLSIRIKAWDFQVSTDFLRRLINAGADLETKDRYSDTPLANASIVGNLDFLKLLISKGAKVNDISTAGMYGVALHRACAFSKLESVKLLVNKGADIDLHHNIVGSPLLCACGGGSSKLDIIKFLVEEQNADINAKVNVARTIMGQACLSSDISTMEYLVYHKGDLSVTSCAGVPPIFMARFRLGDALEMVEKLIEFGAKVSADTKDKINNTVLSYAVLSGSIDLVERFLAVDPQLLNQSDEDG
ncbi:hypothetical protein NHQ30_007116 [Ciborinia camelliae]|nr:hypothetical protein NHQ30_007116 [Ciborinia camelliae]